MAAINTATPMYSSRFAFLSSQVFFPVVRASSKMGITGPPNLSSFLLFPAPPAFGKARGRDVIGLESIFLDDGLVPVRVGMDFLDARSMPFDYCLRTIRMLYDGLGVHSVPALLMDDGGVVGDC